MTKVQVKYKGRAYKARWDVTLVSNLWGLFPVKRYVRAWKPQPHIVNEPKGWYENHISQEFEERFV